MEYIWKQRRNDAVSVVDHCCRYWRVGSVAQASQFDFPRNTFYATSEPTCPYSASVVRISPKSSLGRVSVVL